MGRMLYWGDEIVILETVLNESVFRNISFDSCLCTAQLNIVT